MTVNVRAIPVLPVVGMRDMIGKIWRGLLKELDPVLDGKVAIPFLG